MIKPEFINMELKSEKSIREFLKKLPDDTIIKYYLDVEYTPFPILVIEEYQRIFKRKTKDEILRKLKFQANLAKIKSKQIARMAKRKIDFGDVAKQKTDEIFDQAKKKGYEISEKITKKGSLFGLKVTKSAKQSIERGVKASRNLTSSAEKDLELLKKLSELKKTGIISEKEFSEKKKKF